MADATRKEVKEGDPGFTSRKQGDPGFSVGDITPEIKAALAAGESVVSSTYVNGKRVYLTNRGGVYAPDGNYFGSYLDDNVQGMAAARSNDPNRTFKSIEETETGYRITSENGESYDFYNDFNPTAPQRSFDVSGGTVPTVQRAVQQQQAATTTAQQQAAAARAIDTDPEKNAWAFVRTELDKWGLGGLADIAMNLIIDGAGDEETLRKIRETDTYKTRFSGMAARRSGGLNPITESEYLQMEDQYTGIMRNYGLPSGLFDDPSDFANYIGNDVSADELNTRVAEGYRWAMEADPYEKAQMRALYGLSDGDFAAMALDPDRALPFLEQRRIATEIAGQASRTGWGQLTTAEAESLQQIGVTEDQAAQGFGQLEVWEPLFIEEIGETGGAFSREDQLGAQFGNSTEAQQRLSRRQRARAARAQTGGGAAVTNTGVTGFGSSSS